MTDNVTKPMSGLSMSNCLLHLADQLTNSVTSQFYSLSTFPPLISIARKGILTMMDHSIKYGRLRVLTEQGVYTFPSGSEKVKEPEASAEIRVIRDTFWLRLVTLGDLGFAEAFMAGDCEVSDLVEVFKIFIRSRPALVSDSISGVSTIPSKLFMVITGLTNSRFANTISNSVSNIRAHYDLSNSMFALFLSPDMTYSCGIFPELDSDLKGVDRHTREAVNGGENLKRVAGLIAIGGGERKKDKDKENGKVNGFLTDGKDELEEAQLAKIRHMIHKAKIQPGHRVLEIGSGWGSFAIEAVKTTGCTVDTLTLSVEQKKLAEERIKAAGLAGRIRVWLMDYRNIPESWKGSFDRVVSIEMLEAVGKEFIQGYFSVLDTALNAQGVAVIQVITIPESRFEKYEPDDDFDIVADEKDVDFIRKWIFPGGFLPTVTYVAECANQGTKGRLIIDSISNIGPHYARTLREWRRRFLHNFDSGIRSALQLEHPGMTVEDVEVFKRKWLYYFCYCEIGFTERVLGDHIFTFVREGYSEYGCTTFE